MKRFLKFFGLFLILLVILVGVFIFALPYLVNLEAARNTLARKLSERLGAQVHIEEVSLHLLPRPALKAAGLRITHPRYALKLQEGDLVLSLFPLFRRRIEVEKCLLKGLEITLKEEKTQGKSTGRKSTGPTLEKVFPKVESLLTKAPEIRIEVKNGAIFRERMGQKSLLLERGQVFLALKKSFLEAEISGKNPALKTFSLSFRIWPREQLAEGLLRVKNLDVSRLPLATPELRSTLKTDFSLDLSFRFEEGKWLLGFTGTAPCILAKKEKASLLFDCSALVGKAILAPRLLEVKIEELSMKNPLLETRGVFRWEPENSSFDFQIAKGDWTEIRRRLLLFLKGNKGFQKFAGIVEAGQAEKTTFRSSASSPKGLFKLENLHYEGYARGATVNIPGLDLRLTKTRGFIKITKGLLEVSGAEARCEKVSLRKASLHLDILKLKKEKDSPFSFKTSFSGPFAGIKRILLNLPLPSHLSAEIANLEGKGTLSGWVGVSGRLRKPEIKFSLNPQGLTLKYPRFPFPAELKGGTISYASKGVSLKGVGLSTPGSSLVASIRLRFAQKPWQLELSEARGRLDLKELYLLLEKISHLRPYLSRYRLEGKALTLIDASYRGPLEGKSILEGMTFKISGEGLRFWCPELPTPMFFEKARLSYQGFRLSFEPSRVRWFDACFELTGDLSLKPFEIFLTGKGEAGEAFVSWVFEEGKIPQEFFPKTPLRFSSLEFERRGETLRFNSRMDFAPPSWANFSFSKDGPRWQIKGSLFPRGKEFFHFHVEKGKGLSLTLRGEITEREIKIFLARNPFLIKELKADLKGVWDFSQPAASRFWGRLEVSRFKIPKSRYPIWIESLSLNAAEREILVQRAEFDLDGTYFEAEGKLNFSKKYLSFEGSAYSPHIIVEDLLTLLKKPKEKAAPRKKEKAKIQVVARVDLEADSVIYRNYELSPFRGTIFHYPGSFKVVVTEAYLCDIELRGSFEKKGEKKALTLSFLNPEGHFENTIYCLFHKKDLEGPFELQGEIVTSGERLFEKSSGEFLLRSKKGRIYKLSALSKLFALLSPIDIFSGNLPDFSREGMAYDFLEIKGKFKKNYLKIEALQLNAPGLRFFGTGKIYFLDKKINLTLLVSPFKAFNAVVSKVPLLGWVLTGESKMLLAVPVRITGRLDDPAIVPLDPVSLGSQFLGIVGRTFKLPVKILTPTKKETDKEGP